MKEKEIIEGNKLIAEFMGSSFKTYKKGHIRKDSVTVCYFDDGMSPFSGGVSIENLKYHASWDWLMPVVEKIANIPTLYEHGLFKYMVDVELNPITGIKIEDMYKRNFDFEEEEGFVFEEYKFSFIENIWLACIEFIKWYNSCQK